MTVAVKSEGRGVMAIDITGTTSTANAGQGQVANPEGVNVVILRSTLLTKTASTGAANLGIGVAASGAKGTDILNDAAVNGLAANHLYNGHVMQNGAKTQISAPALWTPTTYVTFTASADMSGYTGTLFLEYLRVD